MKFQRPRLSRFAGRSNLEILSNLHLVQGRSRETSQSTLSHLDIWISFNTDKIFIVWQ